MDDAARTDDRPADGEIPLGEAAHRLGVTVESLRKRLQRGKTLSGRKVGEQWYVNEQDVTAEQDAASRTPWTRQGASTVPSSEPSSPPPTPSTAHGEDATEGAASSGQDAAWTRADMLERELSLTRELLDAERRRADLAERTADEALAANGELRRLLAVAMQGRALAEPSSTTDAVSETSGSGGGERPAYIRPVARTRSRGGLDALRRLVREWLGLEQ